MFVGFCLSVVACCCIKCDVTFYSLYVQCTAVCSTVYCSIGTFVRYTYQNTWKEVSEEDGWTEDGWEKGDLKM